VKLFLDDYRDAPDDTWTVVRTVDEAKILLASGQVDEASLDHDMGLTCPEHGLNGTSAALCGSSCEWPTGYDLVWWMAQTGHWPKQPPIVHSANPCGADNMRAVIRRYFGTKQGRPAA
jgi:hypothetical protein